MRKERLVKRERQVKKERPIEAGAVVRKEKFGVLGGRARGRHDENMGLEEQIPVPIYEVPKSPSISLPSLRRDKEKEKNTHTTTSRQIRSSLLPCPVPLDCSPTPVRPCFTYSKDTTLIFALLFRTIHHQRETSRETDKQIPIFSRRDREEKATAGP